MHAPTHAEALISVVFVNKQKLHWVNFFPLLILCISSHFPNIPQASLHRKTRASCNASRRMAYLDGLGLVSSHTSQSKQASRMRGVYLTKLPTRCDFHAIRSSWSPRPQYGLVLIIDAWDCSILINDGRNSTIQSSTPVGCLLRRNWEIQCSLPWHKQALGGESKIRFKSAEGCRGEKKIKPDLLLRRYTALVTVVSRKDACSKEYYLYVMRPLAFTLLRALRKLPRTDIRALFVLFFYCVFGYWFAVHNWLAQKGIWQGNPVNMMHSSYAQQNLHIASDAYSFFSVTSSLILFIFYAWMIVFSFVLQNPLIKVEPC